MTRGEILFRLGLVLSVIDEFKDDDVDLTEIIRQRDVLRAKLAEVPENDQFVQDEETETGVVVNLQPLRLRIKKGE